jgi:signal transduction histidine kinase
METLLSPRLKNLILCALFAVLAGGMLGIALWPARDLSPQGLYVRVKADCDRMESVLALRVEESRRRSERLRAALGAGSLPASELERKEALVTEKDGIVAGYVGEIFYFKAVPLRQGEWRLIRKNQDVYFLRRIGPHEYYIRFFMDMRANPLQRTAAYPYPVFDLKFSPSPLPAAQSNFSYDQAQDRFYYFRVLAASQDQLVLTLVLSRDTLAGHARRVQKIAFHGMAFLLFLVLLLAAAGGAGRARPALRLLALAGMALSLWLGIDWLGNRDIYFPAAPMLARSVFQLLGLLVAVLLAAFLLRDRVRWKSNFLALAVFNAAAAAAFCAVDAILRCLDFPFGDFSLRPAYLGLLALLVGLHILPLLAAAIFAGRWSWRRDWPLPAVQAVLLLLYLRFWPSLLPGLCLLALAAALLLARPRPFSPGFLLALAFLALSVGLVLGRHSRLEKEAFVSENLRPIFASQDHYAKLVAREIVYELNSRGMPFPGFFDPEWQDDLADCWNNTLAAHENIASGIYVVGADGALLHSFSYQIPYIPLNRRDMFPFWHVENVQANLFGKRVSLAVATINVFRGERYLGYIMVQVLNTADLVLRSRERRSILVLDQQLGDAGLGYVKLDESYRFLENPANINVPNLGALLKADNEWVGFSSMGLEYSGYVFREGEATVIIFFPENTFFKTFSEFVKIFCFLLLLSGLADLRRLRRLQWRSAFGSFSMKVFAILVLLSILTATVFSIFSLNFNFLSLETQRIQAAYGRGRAALNIINNLLADRGELTQADIFLLEKILENDISVYEHNTLLFTSDHRKIIRLLLPVYLNSGVRDLLRRDNQQFVLRRSENALDLYFTTAGHYVFDIEFPFDNADQLRARRYYVDFMVTLFFVLIVIGLAAAFFFRNKILAPIHRLNRGMADVQRGNLSPLAGIPSESELRELYQGFNSMLVGIQEQKKSVFEISRMKTLVQLGRRVAHEVKNPLTPIRLSAEQILRTLKDGGAGGREVIASAVRYIIEETEHLRRVAFGFLNLSKLEELKAEPFRLSDLVAEEIAHLRTIYPAVRFSLRQPEAPIEVVADRQKIKQVIENVLTNALDAVAGREGRIEVAVAEEEAAAEVRVSDNGAGIGPEELETIAREEFSSKDLGTGLGLVIARRFLELHRGSLEIVSRPGEGTTVTMRFAKHVPQA